jgi:hypothetical protein
MSVQVGESGARILTKTAKQISAGGSVLHAVALPTSKAYAEHQQSGEVASQIRHNS